MTIDTEVPGKPTQIRTAAEWLDPTLKRAASVAADDIYRVRNNTYGHWLGSSGPAYRAVAADLGAAADEASNTARDGAEKLRAYAGQLERMKEDFEGLRGDASAAGLTVDGLVIQPPTDPLGYCPGPGSDQADIDAYNAYGDKVEVYNEIAIEVEARWIELEDWISGNLEPFAAGLAEPSKAETLWDWFSTVNATAIALHLNATQASWKQNLAAMKTRADELRTRAAERRAQRRSGNPARRSQGFSEDPRDLRRGARHLDEAAEALRRSGRLLPFIGPGIDILSAGNDIANGESPSSRLVEFGGGILGGLAAGALVTAGAAALGVTAPVWGTALAVTAGAIAVGAGAKWAYDNWVPQDVRESIDAGLERGWDATTDFAEGAWDGVKDVGGGIKDGVSGAWNSVFG